MVGAMSAPKMITVLFNGQKRAELLLDVPEVVIGRGQSAHIALDDNPIVSRRHAVLRMEGDGHVLQDLGGPNGTFVNDEKVRTVRLREGDRVTLGKHTLRYDRGSPEAKSLKLMGERAQSAEAAPGATASVQAIGPQVKAAPWEKPKRAPKPIAGGLGSALGNSEATMAASKDELEALVQQMKIKSGPHLSVTFGGEVKLVELSDKVANRVGWTEDCVVRLPGSVWFSQVAFLIQKRKGTWWIDNHQPFWRSVQVGSSKLKKKRKLKGTSVITVDKLKLRFSPGEPS